NRREIDAVLGRLPFLGQELPVDSVEPVDPAATLAGVSRRSAPQESLHDLIGIAWHAEIGPPHTADLVWIGPDMDQRQLRLPRGRKTVAQAERAGTALLH